MATPRAAVEYYRNQQSIVVRLLLALRRIWSQMDRTGSWSEQYDDGIGAQMVLLITAAQVAATRDADAYTAAVLNELALGPETAAGVLIPTGLAGLAGDGRSVQGLMAQAIVTAGQAFTRDFTTERDLAQARVAELERASAGRSDEDAVQQSIDIEAARQLLRDVERDADLRAQQALDEAQRFIDTVAATILSDTARAAESAALVPREFVEGYVRMLNPPSCSRCIVQAGQFYRWNDGFERHPLCDCRHVPASEAVAGDLTIDPQAYFDSLTRAEQDRIFTASGAQAIRDGADIAQVVNARRGMQVAQADRGQVLVSLEGTTRRGNASRARTGRNQAPRLMPESIYANAADRADAIRLLRLNGFIL